MPIEEELYKTKHSAGIQSDYIEQNIETFEDVTNERQNKYDHRCDYNNCRFLAISKSKLLRHQKSRHEREDKENQVMVKNTSMNDVDIENRLKGLWKRITSKQQ